MQPTTGETVLDLTNVLSGTFDSNGNLTLYGAVDNPFERWEVNRYVTVAPFGCRLIVAVVPFIPNTLSDLTPWVIDATNAGEQDAGGIQASVRTGEYLVFRYVGGRAATLATATFYGKRFVRGNRGYGRSR